MINRNLTGESMLRALFFAIKIGLIAVAAVWVSQRPGTVSVDWLGYQITTHVGIALLGVLVFLLFILFLHRVVLAVAGIPGSWKKRRERRTYEKGYMALTQGLTAVAAGDSKHASERARKTRELWPKDKGLSLLLEAQAARLRGEEDVARAAFDRLLKNKDTAFLGLRGLLVDALEGGDTARALDLARKAQAMHPKQPWIIKMVYDLEIQRKQWLEAEKTLKRAIRYNAIDERQGQRDHVAMLAAQAEALSEKGQKGEAVSMLRKAHRLDPDFVPAAERLAALYIERKNRRGAKNVLEETWKLNPHKDLVRLWGKLTPQNKPNDVSTRLRWFEKLVALKPDSVEGQLAAARAALDDSLWGQAREYLNMAMQIQPSARLYRMYAELEENLYHTNEAKDWLEKAADAPPDKVWTCRETGQIYERWSPVAKPHGSFNTIVWDYPKARAMLTAQSLLPQNEILIAAK